MKRWLIILALATVIAVPFVLRPKSKSTSSADDVLVLITPHNEAIRHEFGSAFATWYEARTGRSVALDWRVIGGTSEIARFLASEYMASFRYRWETELGKPWNFAIQGAFSDGRLPPDASNMEQAARATFLESDVSCGIDLFFGGGPYDFIRQASMGQLVKTRVFETHPEWFAPEVIPFEYAGEGYYDPEHRWTGTVLSSYGMIYNRDVLTLLGIEDAPVQWDDLRDPRLLGSIALTDPTKSGSIAKAFENVIQQQMQTELDVTPADEERAVRAGWTRGLQLLQLAAANARYFTDSSQKPPIDVAAGNCAIGMCIDHEVAELFIEFVMSMDGQKIWNFRPGVAGGPQHFALRRLPVRRDFYTEELKPFRSDPEDEPYAASEQLIYRPEWTGALFREMSFVIRVMGFDAHQELVAAWETINAAGQPAEAMAVLQDMSAVDYDTARSRIKNVIGSRNKVEELLLAKELGNRFRQQYAKAAEIARQSTQGL